MIGYILTLEQKNSVQSYEYAPFQFINCVIDINDVWFTFLTDEDKNEIINNPSINFILSCPQGEYVPKPFII